MDEPVLVRPSELRAALQPLFDELDRRNESRYAELKQMFAQHCARPQSNLPELQRFFGPLKGSRTHFDNYRHATTVADSTSATSDTVSKVANIDAAPKTQGLEIAAVEQAMGATTVGNLAPHERQRGYRDIKGTVKSIESGYEGKGPVLIRSTTRNQPSNSTIRIFMPRDERPAPRKDRRPMFAHPFYLPSSESTSSPPRIPQSTPQSSPMANPASSPPSSAPLATKQEPGADDTSTRSPPSSPATITSLSEDANAQLDIGDDDTPLSSSPLASIPEIMSKSTPTSVQEGSQNNASSSDSPPAPPVADTLPVQHNISDFTQAAKRDDPSSSQNDALGLAKDVPLPGHDEHSGPGMNADHPPPPPSTVIPQHSTGDKADAEPQPASGLNDVEMMNKVEMASETSVPVPTSAPDHGDVTMTTETAPPGKSKSDNKMTSVVDAEVVPMDQSEYSTVGPNAVQNSGVGALPIDNEPVPMDEAESTDGPSAAQTGNNASLTTTANSGSMEMTRSFKTIGDASSTMHIGISRARLPPGVFFEPRPRAGVKRKNYGGAEDMTPAQSLVTNTEIFNMKGAAFDAELFCMLEYVAVKVDKATYMNPSLSMCSFGGQKILHWVPHVVRQIHHKFFTGLKDGYPVQKWDNGSAPDFQRTHRNILEFAMTRPSVWDLGHWLFDVVMPVMVLEKKLAMEPMVIDKTQISKEKLHCRSLPSQDARRDGVWMIFEALAYANLRMSLYLAQQPDSRRMLGRFEPAKWGFLKQEALNLEHECAVNSVIKRDPYDIDAIVSSLGAGNSVERNIAQYAAEHHSRPSSCEPCSYMLSLEAYRDYHHSLRKFVADDGVIEMMCMMRVNTPYIKKIRYTGDTHLVIPVDQRLANIRKIYACLTIADDLWMVSRASSIFSKCAKDTLTDTEGPVLAGMRLAQDIELSIIKDMEATAANLKAINRRDRTPHSVIYDRKTRDALLPLMDRPTETLKLLAIDGFDRIRNDVVMDPRKFQQDSSRSDPIKPKVDIKWGFGPKETQTDTVRIDQPRVKRYRTHEWQQTDHDQIVHEWKYMAPRLGMRASDRWPQG